MKHLLAFILFFTAHVYADDFDTARDLINANKYEEALVVLKSLDADQNQEVLFYLGIVYEGLVQNEMAANSFGLFLESDCKTERLIFAARAHLERLQSIKSGEISDIHQRMQYAQRKLELQDAGEDTQGQQDKIVNMLDRMVKSQEKEEASSSSEQNIKEPSPAQPQSQSNQGKKDSMGKSDKGGKSNQPNGTPQEKTYSDGPQSPWSQLRARERDPAYSAIKDQLPAKYKEIVERYNEKAMGEDR